MSKYLLLRDNKQSGPYTVPELIEMGIKAYDLVWLEGKSAAWRYPSEVDELKAYAPATEEQPFDRFYKRPEPLQKAAPPPIQEPLEHAAYAPKIQPAMVDDVPAQKKVYVNFPVKTPAKKVAEKPHEPAFTGTKHDATSITGFSEQSFYNHPVDFMPSRASSTKQKTDNRPLYISAAVCAILIGFIAILFVNNSRQQQKLKELNTIVKQIENRNANESTPVQQVKNEQPAPAPIPEVSETIVNPELLNTEDRNAVQASTAQSPHPIDRKAPAPEKNAAKNQDANSDVVFTERPVLRRGDDQGTTPAPNKQPAIETSAENLFKLVSVVPNKYKTGVLGGISNLQFHLTNNSKRELQKVAVQVNYLGPEKKVVNTQTIYFENVPANSESTIDVPRSKRGVSINYTVTDIKS